ncbi:myelin-associated glycoprotein-like isoform X5 [Denticeps clupeoides]|uniref:myelin-associated glycoprotein-like isoform X5 n=1 Tax=Denticeps clupeoides TaxID=299321 RepID=UPI0010A43A54|nr:cell adhesion molecule 4 isoform X5 [Denticeps clupeoides]
MTTYSPTLNLGLLSLLSASLMLTCHCGTVPLPQSVQAVEGSCVLVPCHTESHTRVIWYMYHIRTWPKVYDVKDRANVIDQFRERTSVPGSADKGNCTLMIKNVQRSDNEVSLYVNTNPDTEGRQYDPERLVKIFVQTRHSPVIDARPSQVEGGDVLLSCSILHSCPPSPPAFQWKGLSADTGSVSTQEERIGVWRTIATAAVKATPEHNGKAVRCVTTVSSGFREMSRSVMLNIPFAPSILPNSSCTERGGILKCVCLAQSRPEASITWLMDGNQSFTLDSTQKGEVKSATLTGTIKLTPNVNVSCTAVNTHGTATLVMPVWPHQTTQTWIGTEYLWIIVSVCGVTLLGFVTCLCIRQKRRKIHRDSTNALATLETPLRGKLAKVEGDQGTQDIDNIYKNCNSHMSDPIYDYDIQHCYGNYCPAGNEQVMNSFYNIRAIFSLRYIRRSVWGMFRFFY